MKFVCIGDLHFKINNSIEMEQMTKEIIKLLPDMNLDFIVVLGDTLDRHETIHVSPLCQSINFIKELTKISKVFLLIGNHDLKNNKQFLSEEHPFIALKYWENIEVIDTSKEFIICNYKFSFLPYLPNGRFLEGLSLLKWEDSKVIFCHQEFKGCKMGAIISEHGDEWPTNYPLIVSGHIHDYQMPQENIIYTGTPIQHGYGDTSRKTISLFEIDENSKIQHDRIDLKIPRKKIVYINFEEFKTYEPEENEMIKIVISGTLEEIKNMKKSEKTSRFKALGFNFSWKEIKEHTFKKTQDTTNKTFRDILFEHIDDSECKEIFFSLFA